MVTRYHARHARHCRFLDRLGIPTGPCRTAVFTSRAQALARPRSGRPHQNCSCATSARCSGDRARARRHRAQVAAPRLGASGRSSFVPRSRCGKPSGSNRVGHAVRGAQRHDRPRHVVLDAAMMEHETLNYHPLVNTMTTSIGRADLQRFLAATGHAARVERCRAPHNALKCACSYRRTGTTPDQVRRRLAPEHARSAIAFPAVYPPFNPERNRSFERPGGRRVPVCCKNSLGAAAPVADVWSRRRRPNLREGVIEESKRQPVLIDFWRLVGPCKQLTPILEKVVRPPRARSSWSR